MQGELKESRSTSQRSGGIDEQQNAKRHNKKEDRVFEFFCGDAPVQKHPEQRGNDNGGQRQPVEQEQMSGPQSGERLTNDDKDARDKGNVPGACRESETDSSAAR